MQVEWNQEAAGLQLVEVRDLLKEAARDGHYDERGIAARLVPADERTYFHHDGRTQHPEAFEQARRILSMLAASGLIEAPRKPVDVHRGEPRHPGYVPTNLAISLMRASKAPRFTRRKADEAVAAMMAGIAKAAADGALMYDVEEVAIYGSYLTDAETLGDIDVAYKLKARWTGKGNGSFSQMRRALEKAHPPSATQRHAYDHEYTWAEDSVKRMIAPGRRIQLTDIDHVRQLGCPIRVVHPTVSNEPAREGWTGDRAEIVLREDDGSALAAIEADIARLMNGGAEPGTGDAIRTAEELRQAVMRATKAIATKDLPEFDQMEEAEADAAADALLLDIGDAIGVLTGHGSEAGMLDIIQAGGEVSPPRHIPLELGAFLLDRQLRIRPHPLLYCAFPAIAAKHGYVPGMQRYAVPHGRGDVAVDGRPRPQAHAERLKEIMERAGETLGDNVATAIVEDPAWDVVYRGGIPDAVRALDELLARHVGVAARPLADIVLASRGLRADHLSGLMRHMVREEQEDDGDVRKMPEGIRALHTAQPIGAADLAAARAITGTADTGACLRSGAVALGFLPWQVAELRIAYAAEGKNRVSHVDVQFQDGRVRRLPMEQIYEATTPATAPGADASTDDLMPIVAANLRLAFTVHGDGGTAHHQAGYEYVIERGGARQRDPDERKRHWAAMAGTEMAPKAPTPVVIPVTEVEGITRERANLVGRSGSGFGGHSRPPGPDPVERTRYATSRHAEPRSEL